MGYRPDLYMGTSTRPIPVSMLGWAEIAPGARRIVEALLWLDDCGDCSEMTEGSSGTIKKGKRQHGTFEVLTRTRGQACVDGWHAPRPSAPFTLQGEK